MFPGFLRREKCPRDRVLRIKSEPFSRFILLNLRTTTNCLETHSFEAWLCHRFGL